MHVSVLFSLAALFPAALGQLNTLAKAKGLKYFGSATDNPEFSDTKYLALLGNTSQFGQITPGNTQKWQYTEPSQNSFSFTQGDVVTSFAEKNGQMLRCHNLVWHSQLPNWVSSGSWTNATLIAAMKNHIKNQVTHYKGQCYAWDVVNEALNDDGTYRTDVFYNIIGPEYIPIAFETAALYDPTVKLYYNDYNIEYSGPKVTAALKIVASLKARGIKIDGVGLQAHFIVGQTPNLSAQLANLKSFTSLGVEVAYTELDIRFSSLPPSSSGLTQQGIDYVNTVLACVQTANCVGVTIWDYTDLYSWIPGVFSGAGDACLWYSDFTVHPAYNSVVSALQAATVTASVSTTTIATSIPPATLATTTTTTTTIKTTSATTTSAASSPTGSSAGHWDQCGGLNWLGTTVCAAGYTCTALNPYYSQCL